MASAWRAGWIVALALGGALAGGCGGDAGEVVTPPTVFAQAQRFVASREVRRRALVESLREPRRGYAELRLAEYAREDGAGWDAAPVFNPPVCPLRLDQPCAPEDFVEVFVGAEAGAAGEGVADEAALLALGRRAFSRMPLAIDSALERAAETPEGIARAGLWVGPDGWVGGLVRVRLADGSVRTSPTCATCHASPGADGALIDGRANAHLRHDEAQALLLGAPRPPVVWGAGMLDVTADRHDNPVAIPDLRPLALQRTLHWSATLNNSFLALAVRVDTLIITSHDGALRPPREVAAALAAYLWSLAPPTDHQRPELARGREVFARECGRCHHLDGASGTPIPPEAAQLDPLATRSPTRGTGLYRPPSLRGVADRAQLLHDGLIKAPGALDRLLDPARLGDHPAHPFGATLDAADRAALLSLLRAL